MTVETTRAREAPSAARIASSRARRWTWTSVRPAMFATAMSQSVRTAPRTSTSPLRDAPIRASFIGRVSDDQPASVSGNCRPSSAWTTARSRAASLDRNTRTEPAHASKEASVALPHHERRELRRQPDVGRGARERSRSERSRHDADDFVQSPTDHERAANGRRVAAETARPEPLADHRRAGPIGLFFLVEERTADERPHREHREEPRRHAAAVQTLGLGGARVRHVLGIAA